MAKTATAQGKSKVISSRSGDFANGGGGSKVSLQHASPQVPGQTASPSKGGKGKFANGGKGKMFGKGRASPARAGFAGKGSNG